MKEVEKLPKDGIYRTIGPNQSIDEKTGKTYTVPAPKDLAKRTCLICEERRRIRRLLDDACDGNPVTREKLRIPYRSRESGNMIEHEGFTDKLNECPRCKRIFAKGIVGTVIETNINERPIVHSHKCDRCGWEDYFVGHPTDDDLRSTEKKEA